MYKYCYSMIVKNRLNVYCDLFIRIIAKRIWSCLIYHSKRLGQAMRISKIRMLHFSNIYILHMSWMANPGMELFCLYTEITSSLATTYLFLSTASALRNRYFYHDIYLPQECVYVLSLYKNTTAVPQSSICKLNTRECKHVWWDLIMGPWVPFHET